MNIQCIQSLISIEMSSFYYETKSHFALIPLDSFSFYEKFTVLLTFFVL